MSQDQNTLNDQNAGLESLLGQHIVVWCTSFIYSGKLVGYDTTLLHLQEAVIVYETGAHNATTFNRAEELPHEHFVRLSQVESFGKRMGR